MEWLAREPDPEPTIDALLALDIAYVRGDVVGRELATGDPARATRVLDRLERVAFVRPPGAGPWEALRAEGADRERLRETFQFAHHQATRADALDVWTGELAGPTDEWFEMMVSSLRTTMASLDEAAAHGFVAVLEIIEAWRSGRIHGTEAAARINALIPASAAAQIESHRELNAFAMRNDGRVDRVARGTATENEQHRLGALARDMERLREFRTHADLIDFIQVDRAEYQRLNSHRDHPCYPLRHRVFRSSDLATTVEKLRDLVPTVT